MCIHDCVCVVIRCSQDVNYQIIAGAFICFNHLTDQVFIWDRAFNSTVVRLLQVKLLQRRKRLISTVTHGCVHLFRHRPDHFTGHSVMACPFADNSFCMFISSSSLAFFLPPPGSLALLLSSPTDAEVLFFRQSLTLLGSTEKHLAGAYPELSSAYFTKKF